MFLGGKAQENLYVRRRVPSQNDMKLSFMRVFSKTFGEVT
jgi:hypothetical protein